MSTGEEMHSFSLPLTRHTLAYGEAKIWQECKDSECVFLKALLCDAQCRVDSLKQKQKLQELERLTL